MKRLLDVKFDNFEQTLTIKIEQMIKNEVKSQLENETKEIYKELAVQKKDTKKATDEMNVLKTKLDEAVEKVNTLEQSNKECESIAKSNLKYLINTDRNRRANNIIIFGVKEDSPLNLNLSNNTEGDSGEISESEDENAKVKIFSTDKDKVDGLLEFLGLPQAKSSVSNYTRLGSNNAPNRPLKVIFTNTETARSILSAAPLLKSLHLNIYISNQTKQKEKEMSSHVY